MPWDAESFKRKHDTKTGMSGGDASSAARQANAILEKTGDEGMAIAVARKNANKKKAKRKEDGRVRHLQRSGLVSPAALKRRMPMKYGDVGANDVDASTA